MRFLLGVAEAGYFPGIVYYLSHWYPERRRARAISRFAIGVPLAGGIGGPLGATLLGLDGSQGLAGWQWLFLIEGIPAVLLGLVAIRYLTDRPEEARWLTDAERAWLVGRLADRAQGERRTRPRDVPAGASRVPRSGGSRAPYVLFAVGNLALILWLPLLAESTARDQRSADRVDPGADRRRRVPRAMLLIGVSSDRRGDRIGHAAGALAVAAVGCVAAALAPHPPSRRPASRSPWSAPRRSFRSSGAFPRPFCGAPRRGGSR